MKTALPGPKGGFYFGSGIDFRRDQLGFYESCAREYGDVVAMRMGPYRILLIYHPDAIEELFVTRSRDFVKSPGVRLLRPLLGDGLFLSEGDTWLRQRRLVQPAFHRQRVAGYGDVERRGPRRSPLHPLARPGRRRRIPDDRSAGPRRGDDDVPGRPRDDGGGAVVDVVPARAAPRCRCPARRRAARGPGWSCSLGRRSAPAEVRRDGRDGGDAALPAGIWDRSPGGAGDRDRRPSIAPGDIFIAPTWVVHRDPRWFEEPEAFRPERWAGDLTQRLPRFAYFPFGGGPCQCIGNSFAQMEAVLLLAAIAQRFRLSLVPGQQVTPTPYITLRPEPGIRMLVAHRR